ncbi:hypothetical protein LJ707_00270 [Mucilaginibacter sp. UR6-1]|uniref:hypothetical protein n=1 Tax=Mucilaginibacter sp. UR6-1 TaxID=1435643 RepID=UPI001E500EA0|nr:hypothetical protein [Mucilaginibacter sp. UR6-1]MCC8407346.1 hypothetical protein [Mucilaginibacter sp. UR6-1]
MKNLLIIVILALLPICFAAGQTKAKKARKNYKYPTVRYSLPESKKYYDDCRFTNKYSVAQRRKFYPYSKATKILAVSYEIPVNLPIVIDSTDIDTNAKYADIHTGLFVKNGILDHTTLREEKVLTRSQIDSLTSIFYNYRTKVKHDYAFLGYSCFNPRNALVFIDKKGKVFDYLEICFECKNGRSQSEKFGTGTYCTQKYEILRRYFAGLGFKTGTITK